MKYRYTVLICFLVLSVKAQEYKVQDYLDTLCSSYMAGRGYVDDGHVRAANYIANEFKSIGLMPIDDEYFQSFSFDVNTFPNQSFLKVGKKKLIEGNEFISKSFSGPGKGKRKIFHLHNSYFEDSVKLKEFLSIDLSKRALVHSEKAGKSIIQLPLDYIDHFNSAPIRVQLNKRLIASYSSAQYTGVNYMVVDSLYPETAKRVKFKSEPVFVKDQESQNVIGVLPARNESDEYILITAHYDHLGKMGSAYFPGANDNASGVAMIMDLARVFSRKGNLTDYNLVFIAFGGEESGLLGSEYFVKHSPIKLDKMRFVLNLDLMGNGEGGITVVNGSVFVKEFDLLTQLNDESNYVPLIKKRGRAANSDHYHFSKRGVPAFFIYTMGGQAWYHDVYDTPDKLTLLKYSELIELFNKFIESL